MAGIGVISQLVGFVASKVLPQATPDNPAAQTNIRLSTYGEMAANIYLGKKHSVAGEGTLFSTCNVPGTGVTFPTATSYANTAGCFFFQNNNSPGGPVAYLDYLKLMVAGTFTTMTGFRFAIWLDLITNMLITTNHVTAISPKNVNPASSIQSKCNFLYQSSSTASVNAAPSNVAALVANGSMGGIGIAGSEYVLSFGGDETNSYAGLTAAQAVCPSRMVSTCPSIPVPPGWQAVIVPWFPGLGANPTADFELVHIER